VPHDRLRLPIPRRPLALSVLTAPAAPTRAEMAAYVLDPEHISITFFTHHLGFSDVPGMFLEAEGSFRDDAETQELEDLRVVVRTESVFTNHARRDGHLRSADFLNEGGRVGDEIRLVIGLEAIRQE
jgi:polyisoprenoid-binding protein YceI